MPSRLERANWMITRNQTTEWTMTHVIAFLAFLPLACGPKTPPEAAPAASSQPETTMDVPIDAESRKFANSLTDLSIENWMPEDTGMADFRYSMFSFSKDNTWGGAATLTIIDESVNCEESGTWSMESAESASTATITWVVQETDCPGREKGKSLRAKATIDDKGKISLLIR